MTLFSAWSNLYARDGNLVEAYRDAARRKIGQPEHRKSLVSAAARHRYLALGAAERRGGSEHRRGAGGALHARPAGLSDQRLPEPFQSRAGRIVLHERSGQGAHLRAVQRLQPRNSRKIWSRSSIHCEEARQDRACHRLAPGGASSLSSDRPASGVYAHTISIRTLGCRQYAAVLQCRQDRVGVPVPEYFEHFPAAGLDL
jgi:hypothetical protein